MIPLIWFFGILHISGNGVLHVVPFESHFCAPSFTTANLMGLPSNNQWTRSFSTNKREEEKTPSMTGSTFDDEVCAVILPSAASDV